MPEGDTIFKIAAEMAPRLEGAEPVALEISHRATQARLTGRKVLNVYAHGKHLFVEFDGGVTVRSHLGMHGDWHRYDHGLPWKRSNAEAGLTITTEREVFVCFNPRDVELLDGSGIRRRDITMRLGPDLLVLPVDFDTVLRRAREFPEPDAKAVDVLLDQRIASGIGNVYKSEVLFLQGVHPETPLRGIADGTLLDLYRRSSELLSRNTGGGPRVTRFEPGPALWVYGRAGLECLKCAGALISSARLGVLPRSTYWCAKCQPAIPV